jgi:hypothetical protein
LFFNRFVPPILSIPDGFWALFAMDSVWIWCRWRRFTDGLGMVLGMVP